MSDKYDVTIHYKDGYMDRYHDVMDVTFKEGLLTLALAESYVYIVINEIKYWTRRKEKKV